MSKAKTPQFARDQRTANYRLAAVDERANVDIGGPGEAFLPRVRSEKWGGRCWMDIAARGVEKDVAEERVTKHGRHRRDKQRDKLTAEIVRTSRKTGKRRGEQHRFFIGDSFDWDIEWQSAADLPDETNDAGDMIVEFDVSSPAGLAFHYQPELTAEEIADGHERPEDIIGSYAAYWDQSGRFLDGDGHEIVNYETGKYAHLKRPLFICADGSQFWGYQNISNGVLTVAAPRDIISGLGAAQYPLTLDPTFGYTSAGGSYGGNNANHYANANATYQHAATAGDTITEIALWTYGSGTQPVAVYNTTSGYPNSLIGESTVALSGSYAWATTSGFSLVLSGGVTYTLALGLGRHRYDVGAQAATRGGTGAFPATWPAATNRNETISIYATYTAGGVAKQIHHMKMAGGL